MRPIIVSNYKIDINLKIDLMTDKTNVYKSFDIILTPQAVYPIEYDKYYFVNIKVIINNNLIQKRLITPNELFDKPIINIDDFCQLKHIYNTEISNQNIIPYFHVINLSEYPIMINNSQLIPSKSKVIFKNIMTGEKINFSYNFENNKIENNIFATMKNNALIVGDIRLSKKIDENKPMFINSFKRKILDY